MIKNTLLKIITVLIIFVKFVLAKFITFFMPLRKNKFFCIAMTGNCYGDSIKCLSDYIYIHHSNSDIVWAFSKSYYDKVNCEHKKIKMYTFSYYYHIMTAKFILSNVSLDKKMLVKRKGQVCVQTWHGTALKRIGIDMYPKKYCSYMAGSITRYNARLTDILVSGSRYMTEIYHTKCLYPMGIIHEIGTPRNDVFFYDTRSIRRKVCEYYNISDEMKIILYAPTFRSDGRLTYYDVDLEAITSFFQRKNDEQYVVMVRLHPNLLKKEESFTKLFQKGTINASLYPDIIDLLCASDVLVTDYSSCMFDFMYSYKPIILYVPDRSTYDRGFYLDIDKLPFVIINSNTEIKDKLSAFDSVKYREEVNDFLSEIGSKEQGLATEKLYNLLESFKV